jgi:hypothetical protein
MRDAAPRPTPQPRGAAPAREGETMARGVPPRRALAAALALALLAVPVGAGARAPEWDAGDVEAAERYRALARERALRFRATAEERVGEPRRGERASRPGHDPVDELLPERDERPRRLARDAGRSARETDRRARDAARSARDEDRGWAPDRGWLFGDEPAFEPWVTRFAEAVADALLRAFERAAYDAWWSLRDAFEAWLDQLGRRERPTWTEWREGGWGGGDRRGRE